MEEIVKQSEQVAGILKTLGHPKRLLILCFLREGAKSVGQLEELCDIAQSQLSLFLKRMDNEGLIKNEREGNFIYYSIKDERVLKLINELNNIFCS